MITSRLCSGWMIYLLTTITCDYWSLFGICGLLLKTSPKSPYYRKFRFLRLLRLGLLTEKKISTSLQTLTCCCSLPLPLFFLRLFLLTIYVPNSSKTSPHLLNSSVFPSALILTLCVLQQLVINYRQKKCRRPVVRWEQAPAHPSMAACHLPPPALGWEGRVSSCAQSLGYP